jgi:two-component system, NtrC family, sensor kinase
VTVPVAVLVASHGLLRLAQEDAQVRDEDNRSITLLALATQIAVENALRDWQISDVRRLVVEIADRQEGIDRIRLFDRQLQPTLVSNALHIGDAVPSDALRAVITRGAPVEFSQGTGKKLAHVYLVPLRDGGTDVVGALEIVRLGSPVERRMRSATIDIVVRLGILVVAVVVLVTSVLQWQVVRPLALLVHGLQRLGHGQTGPPLPVLRHDEFGRAAQAFNDTAAQLDAARARLLSESERALELERRLQRAASLTIAGKLASAMAHEVGTPLNVIGGHAEVALKALSEDSPVREDLQIIADQSDRIAKIINSLLDTVRPQAPVARSCDVAPVLDPLVRLFESAARARGVTLTSAADSGTPSIRADTGQLQQVVSNLVMNALEATPRGGRVSISVGPATEGARPGVRIAVADTGSGIGPDALPHVFEPFFTTKPRGQGTGLGLAISRDIVVEHGGEIRVETEEGRGTTVEIWLPAEQTA